MGVQQADFSPPAKTGPAASPAARSVQAAGRPLRGGAALSPGSHCQPGGQAGRGGGQEETVRQAAREGEEGSLAT